MRQSVHSLANTMAENTIEENITEEIDNRTLGEITRSKRVELDLSLRDLAKIIRKAPSYVSDIENDRRVPAEEVIRDIAQALELDADDLMARAGRFGADAERYMKRNPAAGVLLRRISSMRLGENALQQLLDEAERLGDSGKE